MAIHQKIQFFSILVLGLISINSYEAYGSSLTVQECQEAFNLFETNGSISTSSNLRMAMNSLGYYPTETEFNNITNEANAEEKGNITLPEFIKIMGCQT